MNVKINVGEFKRAAKLARLFVQRNTTIPVLNMVKITAKNGQLLLSATDLDGWIDFAIEGHSDQDGSFLLDINTLSRTIIDMPGTAEISFTPESEFLIGLNITAADIPIEMSLQSLHADDYPLRPGGLETWGTIEVLCSDLRTALDRVRFAISTEETRYYLNGVCWFIKNDHLETVATDGHRLALYRQALPGDTDEAFKTRLQGDRAIIPRKMVENLVKILPKEGDSKIVIAISDTRITFECDAFKINAKLIDGSYPDYDRVIPAYVAAFPMEINRNQLMRFSSLSNRFRRKKGHDLATTKMIVDGPSVDLKSYNSLLGKIHSRVAAAYKGPAYTMGYNPRYMAEILRAIRSENVVILTQKDDGQEHIGQPVKITGTDDPNFLAVLMPMRV